MAGTIEIQKVKRTENVTAPEIYIERKLIHPKVFRQKVDIANSFRKIFRKKVVLQNAVFQRAISITFRGGLKNFSISAVRRQFRIL